MADYIVESGEVSSGIILMDDTMTVYNGGTANSTTVNNYGILNVDWGGTANSTTVNTNGSMNVYGTANSTTLNFGSMFVGGGEASANDIIVGSGGYLLVYSGGTATNVAWTPFVGQLQINQGAVVTFANTCSGVYYGSDNQLLSHAATMYGLFLEQNYAVYVMSNGTANNTTVNYGNNLHVFSGGIANSTTVNNGGWLNVSSGGTANNTFLSTNGRLNVFSGGTANYTTFNSYGVLHVSSGGMANNAIVSSGHLLISSGGTANSTTVNLNGKLYVSSGGTASNTRINSGGTLTLEGMLTGKTFFEKGGIINAKGGAEINFDISNYAPGTNALLLNDLSIAQGVNFTLTVSVYQWNGTYTLAKSSDGFDSPVFVKSPVNGTTYIATVDDMITVDGVEYTLNLSNDTLSVTVSGSMDIPIIPVSADIIIPTDQDVTLTAEFNDSTVVREYSLNEGETWDVYTGPVKCQDNGTVYFLGKDQQGHVLETATYVISNIEKGYTSSGLVLSYGQSAQVSFSELFTETTISSGGELTVLSGGMANETTVSSGGYLNVSSGGTANSTTVQHSGWIDVHDGGNISNTVVKSSGRIYVYTGGSASFTTVQNQAVLYLGFLDYGFGGFADQTTVNSGGSMFVSSGGTANHTTVNSGGRLYVSSGGTATDIVWTPCEGHVYVMDGGYATFAGEHSGVYYGFGNHLHSNAISMNSITISSSYEMYVMNDGTVNNTTIDYYGSMFVWNGGTADNNTVNNYGNMFVSSGGTANNTRVNYEARMYVSNGGMANNTSVYRGFLYVSNGGTANNTSADAWGSIFISSGGKLTGRMMFESGATVQTYKDSIFDFDLTGATPDDDVLVNDLSIVQGAPTYTITIDEDLSNGLYLLADGTDSFDGTITVVNTAGAELGVLAIGTPVEISGVSYTLSLFAGELSLAVGCEPPRSTAVVSSGVILIGETQDVNSGELYYRPVVSNGGKLNILAGGTAKNAKVRQNGNLNALDGGMVNSTIVYSSGIVHVSSGGTANSTTVNSYGCFHVSNGGTADNTMVNEYGSMFVSSGGTANRTNVNYYGYFHVSIGGTANSTTVTHGGYLHVSNGGMANNTNVNYSAYFYISSGGTANNTTVNSGGSLFISNGGRLTGQVMINSGAYVSFDGGAILDFDLTKTSATAMALVNDLSRASGAPIYTLTVDGTQDTGTYRLADGVSVFTGVIAVMNTFGEQIGILMVGQKLKTEYTEYTLNVTKGSLTVTVDNAAFVPPDADSEAPTDPDGLMTIVNDRNVALLWNESTDNTGVKEYIVKYSLDGEIFTARTTIPHYLLNNADYGSYSWSVSAVDIAGNVSAVTVGDAFAVTSFKPYTVEYSADHFEHAIRFTVTTPTLNTFRMSGGTYQMRVMPTDSVEWMEGDPIVAPESDMEPQLIQSDADGNADVFFANSIGTWESGYLAQHVGSINDWSGTDEYAVVFGKNKLADIFEGSDDANVLLLTDDANGDALFVDDIYTASPGSIAEKQSRIAQIDEIRAGEGNDIVDMTSHRFEYTGDGLTIRGGNGDDTIWANKGDNNLFGDAGNDRIVGASGNDVIAGGIGNDRMHGGGGDDVFTFCENWGIDTVEQLAGSSVTLWFASGSMENWDKTTLTYTDGDNSVKVTGVTADKVALKFGDDGSDEFVKLTSMGAFFDATTERIFEESGKGILASL